MRTVPNRPSIDEEGVRPFLKHTKSNHNDLDDDDLDNMLKSPLKYTKAQIAMAFGVSREQLYQWMRRDSHWATFIDKEVSDGSGS